MMNLFTIGHSNHSFATFVDHLQRHQVTALADVRSSPYSRYVPHFNQAPLAAALQTAGIHYVFLGQELGARPADCNCYVQGKALYEKIAATPVFATGIQRILKGAATHTIALMCAERDPITCHRAILVGQHLRTWDLNLQHILSDGSLETHTQLEDRLLIAQGLMPTSVTQLSLFADPLGPQLSRETALRRAYHLQGEQCAYVELAESQYESIS
jgi:uncharacterized protein (DUF488 family)